MYTDRFKTLQHLYNHFIILESTFTMILFSIFDVNTERQHNYLRNYDVLSKDDYNFFFTTIQIYDGKREYTWPLNIKIYLS